MPDLRPTPGTAAMQETLANSRVSRHVLLGLATSLMLAGAAFAQKSVGRSHAFANDIRPLLTKYCFECHRNEKAELGVNLAVFADERSAAKAPKLWKKVREQLHSR